MEEGGEGEGIRGIRGKYEPSIVSKIKKTYKNRVFTHLHIKNADF